MKFTVGIAAYNEEKTLPKTIPLMLEHLGKNHLIISACGSDTIRIANELAKKDERIIIIEEHKREGKAAALNKILKAAKTEVIILTDADVIPEKGSFELISEHFKKPNIGYVSGRAIALNNDKSVFTFYANFSYGTMHELRLKCHKLPTGYLFGIRKSSVSPIPDCHSEDALIGTMISSNGYEFVYEPKAVVKVLYPTNWKDFFIQKTRTRLGHLEVKHRMKMNFREFRPRGEILNMLRKYNTKEKLLIAFYMLAESLVWIKAWVKFKTGRKGWERVESSKKI